MKEDVIFTKKKGMKITGKLFLPDGGADKYPVFIFSHGFGGNFRYLEHYAQEAAEQGIACLVFDFCGGGPESLSDGDMLGMTVLTETEDLLTVVEGIKQYKNLDATRLFLMGESQGGYVSALTASRIPEQIKAMVLWYPAFVIGDDSAKRLEVDGATSDVFGFKVSRKFNEDAVATDIYAEIPKYQGDVLIIHGDKDEIVPLSYSERAVDVYDSARLIVVPGAGHGYEGEDSVHAFQEAISFMKKHIQ